MSETVRGKPGVKMTGERVRRARLEDQLRTNLKRRKRQIAARREGDAPPDGGGAATAGPAPSAQGD